MFCLALDDFRIFSLVAMTFQCWTTVGILLETVLRISNSLFNSTRNRYQNIFSIQKKFKISRQIRSLQRVAGVTQGTLQHENYTVQHSYRITNNVIECSEISIYSSMYFVSQLVLYCSLTPTLLALSLCPKAHLFTRPHNPNNVYNDIFLGSM